MTDASASWSVGETSALAVKAARGVGMPWGLAEEAGFALGWLTRHGAPGVSALCRYLSGYRQSLENGRPPSHWPDDTDGGWFCPLSLGTAISDGAIPLPVTLSPVREPLLLVPFIAGRVTDDRALLLNMGTVQVTVSHAGLTGNVAPTRLLVAAASCRIGYGAATADVTHADARIRVQSTATECIAVLTRLAHKTYAPATEESRLAGAGAGLKDND